MTVDRVSRRELKQLNNRQVDFLNAYQRYGDVEKAAEVAGFTPKYGHRLKKTLMRQCLEIDAERIKEAEEYGHLLASWTDAELLSKLVIVTRYDATTFYHPPDEQGIVHAKKLSELSPNQRAIITGIRHDTVRLSKDTYKVVVRYELLSVEWATNALAKTFGTYNIAAIAEKLHTSKKKILEAKVSAGNM